MAGKLTELRIVPVSRKSRMVSAAMEAAASSASSVEAPRWGRRMDEGWFQRRSSGKSETYLFYEATEYALDIMCIQVKQ